MIILAGKIFIKITNAAIFIMEKKRLPCKHLFA
jgi:hypothetical protein